jgi:hypothetical protein
VIDAGAFIVYRPLQWWLICESSRPPYPVLSQPSKRR